MTKKAICVVGNPNCGKTTLFNALTGAKQDVGNWPGVTVEKKTGSYAWRGEEVEITDLPGIYSITPSSAAGEDERRQHARRREAAQDRNPPQRA